MPHAGIASGHRHPQRKGMTMDFCEIVERLATLITGHTPRRMSDRELCHEAIKREHAPDELEAKAIARADRHLDRGWSIAKTLDWVLPWLRAEVRRDRSLDTAQLGRTVVRS